MIPPLIAARCRYNAISIAPRGLIPTWYPVGSPRAAVGHHPLDRRALPAYRCAIPANRDAFPGKTLRHLPPSAIIPVNIRLYPREQEAP